MNDAVYVVSRTYIGFSYLAEAHITIFHDKAEAEKFADKMNDIMEKGTVDLYKVSSLLIANTAEEVLEELHG